MRQIKTKYGDFNILDHDSIGRDVGQGAFWEEYCRPYFDGFVPESAFIDVGANYGFYSIYMGRKGHKTVAFEPAPGLFEILESNVLLNNLGGNVSTFNAALWDGTVDKVIISPDFLADPASCLAFKEDGAIDWEHMPNSGGMSVVPGHKPSMLDKKQNVIKATAIDDYYGWWEGRSVGLIKVDAQGADLRILRGAMRTIKEHRPWLLFEYEPQPALYIGDTLQMCYDFMEEIDYVPEVLHSVGEEWRQFGAKPK